MSDKHGENITVSFSDGIKTVNAVAIREKDGNILLLLHPLISSLTLGRSGKMSRAYGINILSIIYGEKINNTISVKDIFPFYDFTVKRLTLVSTAMREVSEKLRKVNFKNKITVNFENMNISISKAVDFTTVVYVLAEILSVENTFSDGKSAVLTFCSTENTLDIILKARSKKKPVNNYEIFARLFCESLRLYGVHAQLDISSDGFIIAKASINTEITTSYVREPGVYIEEAIWSYFDFCMDYNAFGEKEQ